MAKKVINALLSIVFSVPLFTGIFASADLPMAYFSSSETCSGDYKGEISFQKPCDMDHCNPFAPKCPLCPSWGMVNIYLLRESGAYLPPPTSSLIGTISSTLSDQGVVRTIFHPPTQLA